MDEKEMKKTVDMRPLGLTLTVCLLSIVAALDMEHGIGLFGYLLLGVAVGVFCVIWMTCEKHIFVLDAAAMLIILFFTSSGSLELALLGAVTVITAMILSVCIQKKSAKTSAVLSVCLSFSIGAALVWAIFYAAEGNSLMPDELLNRLNGVFDGYKIPIAKLMRESMSAISDQYYTAIYERYEITKEMFISLTVESMEAYVDYLQMLLPGIFLFFAQALAYISVISFEKTVKSSRYDALLPEVRWILFPQQATCIIYLIVATLYMFASIFSPASIFGIIVTNCWIAFLPVMLACGCGSLLVRLKHPIMRRGTVIILIIFAVGALFAPDTALNVGLFMLAFMGAQDASLARTAEMTKKHFDGQDDRDQNF